MLNTTIVLIFVFLFFNIYVLHKQDRLDYIITRLYLKDMYNDMNDLYISYTIGTNPNYAKQTNIGSYDNVDEYIQPLDNTGSGESYSCVKPTESIELTQDQPNINTNLQNQVNDNVLVDSKVVYNDRQNIEGLAAEADFYSTQEEHLNSMFEGSMVFDEDSADESILKDYHNSPGLSSQNSYV